MSNQTITVEDLEKFTTDNRREIVFYLHQLINDGERVSLIFNDGDDTLLTVLLHVDEAEDMLIFDWGGSENVNRRLLRSDRNFFVAAPHGVRNQFSSGIIYETAYKGRPAFATRIPKSYTRLQRREYFRLILPMTRRPVCRVSQEDGAMLELTVVDISIGGIAAESPGGKLPFAPGATLKGAHIELKGIGILEVDLEVRNASEVHRGSKTYGRVGCNFVKLSRGMEGQLQRFITDVQREERARMGA